MKKKQKRHFDKAYLKAVEEIEKDRINEVKVIVKQVLEGIVAAQKERKAAEEKEVLLKQDLDDIRHGKIEKIKARHAEKRMEQKWVPFDEKKLEHLFAIGEGCVRLVDASHSANNSLGVLSTTGNFNLSDGSVVTVANMSNQ